MIAAVQLYWSFRSPYSYLVTSRVRELAGEPGVDLQLKIVYPLAVRLPDYYAGLPPQRRNYFKLDPKRVAEYLGIPFASPDPDPVAIDPHTRRPAREQPHIRRLSHLGIEAVRRGRGLPFVDEVSKIIWSGAVRGWDRGEHLAEAARRAGLDLGEMQTTIAADEEGYDLELQANGKALEASGHWGVPTFVLDGEPFFGQDRFNMLLWRLRQKGVRLGSAGPADASADAIPV